MHLIEMYESQQETENKILEVHHNSVIQPGSTTGTMAECISNLQSLKQLLKVAGREDTRGRHKQFAQRENTATSNR
jgi:hypothetical protein